MGEDPDGTALPLDLADGYAHARGRIGAGVSPRAGARAVLTLALALAVVLATVAPAIAVAATPAAASSSTGTMAPDGMLSIPDENVESDNASVSASRFQSGAVLASEHAESLELEITTAERAKEIMGSDSAALRGDDLALVLRDDRHDAGREIAIDAGELKDLLGYRPEALYGTHESGERWTATATYEDGYLVFDVPHFSSNTITFSGTVEVAGSFADGSSTSYSLSDVDSASNLSISVTGSENSEWDNETATLSNGEAVDLPVAGNLPPTGPSPAGEPVVEFTGVVSETWANQSLGSLPSGGSTDITVGGTTEPSGPANGEPEVTATYSQPSVTVNNVDNAGEGGDESYLFSDPPSYAGSVSYQICNSAIAGSTYDIELYRGPDGGDLYTEQSGVYIAGSSCISNTQSFNADTNGGLEVYVRETEGVGKTAIDSATVNGRSTADSVTVTNGSGATASLGSISDGGSASGGLDLTSGTETISMSTDNGAAVDVSLDLLERDATVDPSLDLGDDGTTEASVSGTLADGETVRKELPGLSTSSTTASIESSGEVDVAVRFRERTETRNPTVAVNGETTSYSGRLAEGETVKLSSSDSWLQSGSNTVAVEVGDASLSADAPTPTVGLEYAHKAEDQQSVDVTSTKWNERVNASRTYARDRSESTFTRPFSSEVVEIRSVEYRKNGGEWESPPESSYSLNGTELTFSITDVTSVNAGDEIEVRTTGSKVSVADGSITVLEPTLPSEVLDSKISLDSWGPDGEIRLDGRRIPYTTKETYEEPSERALIDRNGARLRLPEASASDELRVKRMDVKANPSPGGDVLVQPIDTDTSPEFAVSSGLVNNDEVTFVYLPAVEGEKYVLESVSNNVVRDQATANSPVYLTDDDSEETLEIRVDDDSTNTSGGGGVFLGGASAGAVGGGGLDIDLGLPIFGGVLILGLALLAYLRRRGLISLGGSSSGGVSRSESSSSSGGGSRIASAVGSVGSRVRSAFGRAVGSLPVVGSAVRSIGSTAVGAVGRLSVPLRRATGTAARGVGSRAFSVLRDPLVILTLAVGATVALARSTALGLLPQEIWVIVVIALVLTLLFVGLRRFGRFSWPFFGLIAGATIFLGSELVAPGTVIPVIGEGLARFAPLVLGAGLYLAYKWIESRNRDVNITLPTRGGSS